MGDLRVWIIIAAIVIATALLRFLPFWVFGSDRKTPAIIDKLGRILPYAVMGMLVVYCLKGVSFASMSGFLPTLIATLLVTVLYVWKRNTLLSIMCGTVCYMVFVQLVF